GPRRLRGPAPRTPEPNTEPDPGAYPTPGVIRREHNDRHGRELYRLVVVPALLRPVRPGRPRRRLSAGEGVSGHRRGRPVALPRTESLLAGPASRSVRAGGRPRGHRRRGGGGGRGREVGQPRE